MEDGIVIKYHGLNTPSPSYDSPRQASQQRRCIPSSFRFLGPFRPFFGGHTIAEAGGSVLLPTAALLIYRLLCTCGFVFTLVLYTATGDFHFTQYGVWFYLGAALAMSCATFSSLCFLLFPELQVRGTSNSFRLLTSITVPIYQAFVVLTIAGDVLYWSFLREPRITHQVLLLYAGSAVVMLVDFVLAARITFRFSYIVLGEVLPILWLLFAWMRFAVVRNWMYTGLDSNHVGTARVVFFHAAFLMAPPLFGSIFLGISRINPIALVVARARNKLAKNDTSSVLTDDGLRIVTNVASYADLTTSANSTALISVSAPLPMYQPSGTSTEQYIRSRFGYP